MKIQILTKKIIMRISDKLFTHLIEVEDIKNASVFGSYKILSSYAKKIFIEITFGEYKEKLEINDYFIDIGTDEIENDHIKSLSIDNGNILNVNISLKSMSHKIEFELTCSSFIDCNDKEHTKIEFSLADGILSLNEY